MILKDIMKNLTPEQYTELGEKAKLLNTAEEIKNLYKEYNIEIDDKKALRMLLNSGKRELSDDDLVSVNGGNSVGDPCSRTSCDNNEDGYCDCYAPCWICELFSDL